MVGELVAVLIVVLGLILTGGLYLYFYAILSLA
jgi:hypothetical protein